jgi:ABC-type glycerol-3-phosphate transport system substrate-binding protein
MRPIISDFEAVNPDVKVNYVFQSQREYRERLQNALAAGRGPDVFRIHNTWVPMFRSDLASLPADVYSASEFESIFYPVTRSDLRVGSGYVAVPLMIDGLALFTNDQLFAQGGKKIPVAWEELRKTANDLSVCDSSDGRCTRGDRVLISGVAMGTSDNVDHWQDILAVLMLQNNVNLAMPVGQSTEETLQYFTIFNRADHIWDSTLPTSTVMFANGKLAMYFAPSWRVFDLMNINPKLKFTVSSIPQLPLDSARGEKPVTWASYWVEGVNKNSAQSAASWKWIKYLSSREAMQKMYQTASNSRAFGELYSRPEMASLINNPFAKTFLTDAVNARSWYLASNTYDGATGINSKISAAFAESIDAMNQGKVAAEATKTLSTSINGVLSQYGLASQFIPPTP